MHTTSDPAVLSARGITHRYGPTLALDDVELEVAVGECVALLGPNGAGKTTLANLVTGLLAAQHGAVRLAGADPRVASTRRNLGVVQQSVGLPKTLKVGELVAGVAVRARAPRSAAGPVLAEPGPTELAGRRAVKLSGGQTQRLQLAMALVGDPALLVLDEPTVGLDTEARRAFWRTLEARRARGTAILLTTHLIEESAATADRVVVIDGGRVLASDRPSALTARLPDRTVIARTRLDQQALLALPGVVSVTTDGEPGTGGPRGDRVRLATRAPEDLLRRLLVEDPTLTDLRVEGAGLEQAVLSLTAPGSAPSPPSPDHDPNHEEIAI